MVFVEVKSKASGRYGSALAMVGPEKARRIRRAASAYLAAHRELRGCAVRFDVVAEEQGRLQRFPSAL